MRSLRTPLDDLEIERIDWAELGPAFIAAWGRPNGRYDPQHLTAYGPSGSGKTFFVLHVLKMRALARGSHVVVVATKPTDRTLSRVGWPEIGTWPPPYGTNQVIYKATAKGITAAHRAPQKIKVAKLMNALWTPHSNIVVYWDELPYIETSLGLKVPIETFYREGRSLGITNVASMQRPAGVSRLAHSEAGWTVAFRPRDADDRDRVAEVFGDRARYREALNQLDRRKHEFLLRHDLTGETYVSNLPSRDVRSRQTPR